MYIGSMHIFTEKYSMCHQQDDQAAKVRLFVQDFDTLDRILWIQISETLSLFTCQETFLEVFFSKNVCFPQRKKEIIRKRHCIPLKASKRRTRYFNQ